MPRRPRRFGSRKRYPKGVPSVEVLLPYASDCECYLVAEQVASDFPALSYEAGYYVYSGDEPGIDLRDSRMSPKDWSGFAGDHAWCMAPDGTIIDPTYAQIDPAVKVAFIPPSDPRYARYRSWREHHPDGPASKCLLRTLRVDEECQVEGCTWKGLA